MRHADFARLLPSEKRVLIDQAVADLAFPARLVTFSGGLTRDLTSATVELSGHRSGADEFVTYLVCPQNVGPKLARTGRHSGSVYLDAGNYGFMAEQDATADMFRRAAGC
jgi:hypothetical protein